MLCPLACWPTLGDGEPSIIVLLSGAAFGLAYLGADAGANGNDRENGPLVRYGLPRGREGANSSSFLPRTFPGTRRETDGSHTKQH